DPSTALPPAGGASPVCRLLCAGLFVAGCLGAPSWSPDGHKIAYTRIEGQTSEVRLLDIDAARPPRLLASQAFLARWLPDGSRVYFLAARTQDRKALSSCRPDGGDVQRHVSRDEVSVGWYALGPDGRSAFYLDEKTGALMGLDLGTGASRPALKKGAKCLAAALDPSGRLLACAVKVVDDKGTAELKLRLVGVEAGAERQRDVPVPIKELDVTPTVLFSPPGRHVVVSVDPGRGIHVVPVGRGRARRLKAARGGKVVFASISPDGGDLYLTVWSSPGGKGAFTSQRVDLLTGDSEVLVENSPVAVGGRSWEPDGDAFAELTPMGIKVSTADGRWAKHYPVGADEYRQLARKKLRAKDPAMAAALVREALEKVGPGADVQALRQVQSDAFVALDDRREAARALLAGWLLHPISTVETVEFQRRASALDGEDRLLDVLSLALRGSSGSRARILARGFPLVGDPGLVAGLNFRIGEALLEEGDHQDAGKHFRLASETRGFSAADCATGLAALSFYVAGGGRSRDKYAEGLLLRAIELFPRSPFRGDFRDALERVRDPANAALRRTDDVTHPSGAAAWVSVRTSRSVEWDGRNMRLELAHSTSLFVARPKERARAALADLGGKVGRLTFSPKGRYVAFIANGAAAYVIDLDGKVVVGDGKALASGKIPATGGITGLAWEQMGRSLFLKVISAKSGGGTAEKRIAIPAARPLRRAPPGPGERARPTRARP
ncbi:MAG: TolB family protein, partial [Planctomycetota bacterium]